MSILPPEYLKAKALLTRREIMEDDSKLKIQMYVFERSEILKLLEIDKNNHTLLNKENALCNNIYKNHNVLKKCKKRSDEAFDAFEKMQEKYPEVEEEILKNRESEVEEEILKNRKFKFTSKKGEDKKARIKRYKHELYMLNREENNNRSKKYYQEHKAERKVYRERKSIENVKETKMDKEQVISDIENYVKKIISYSKPQVDWKAVQKVVMKDIKADLSNYTDIADDLETDDIDDEFKSAHGFDCWEISDKIQKVACEEMILHIDDDGIEAEEIKEEKRHMTDEEAQRDRDYDERKKIEDERIAKADADRFAKLPPRILTKKEQKEEDYIAKAKARTKRHKELFRGGE